MNNTSVKSDYGTWSSAHVQRCPHQFLDRIREEMPVYFDTDSNLYIVSRFEDIAEVTANPQVYSNRTAVVMGVRESPVADEISTKFRERGFQEMHTLGTNDPPSHTAFRGLVDRIFTPSYVRSLEPEIEKIADDLIDQFQPRGRAEVVREFSIKLPMFVISDQLGVDRKDVDRFKTWSTATMERQDPTLTPERQLEIADAIIDMQNYLFQNIERYRREPTDNLLSHIVNARIGDEPLSNEALLSLGHQFLVAGNETTTTGITSAIQLLLTHPELQDAIRADPKLAPQFVEETLRIHSPTAGTWRQTTQATTLGGVDIPEGAIVMIHLLAGNHDPANWECPAEVRLGRKGGRNHLAFGRGIHFCIGNALARTEIRLSVQKFLERLPNMRLAQDRPPPRIAAMFATHGFEALEIEFDASQ